MRQLASFSDGLLDLDVHLKLFILALKTQLNITIYQYLHKLNFLCPRIFLRMDFLGHLS